MRRLTSAVLPNYYCVLVNNWIIGNLILILKLLDKLATSVANYVSMFVNWPSYQLSLCIVRIKDPSL